MKCLRERGLIPLLNEMVVLRKVPVLGLCLGMQLMTQRSEEGQSPGLGWLEAETLRFNFDSSSTPIKVPHMGWNTLAIRKTHPLFADLETENRFYFVHSYHVVCADPVNVLAETNYGIDFCSAVIKANIVGVQFHPEKSHKFGMLLFKNFSQWDYA
jgi:glutamine amidotransferase